MSINLDEVQKLADKLSALDQLRLIEYLSRRIAPALEVAPATGESADNDAWARLAALRQELAALPAGRSAGEQLEADRTERQSMIEGSRRVHD